MEGSVGTVHGTGLEGGWLVFAASLVAPDLTWLDCCGRHNIWVMANSVFSTCKVLWSNRMLEVMAMQDYTGKI